jgi:cytochrome c556
MTSVEATAQPAPRRPYDVVMKEVGSTVATLRKNLEGGDAGAVAADAGRLERLFKETEDFWTPFRTRDALDAAKGARDLSGTIAAAAKEKDVQKARTASAGLGRFCTACHNSHREQMPDKSYRIRP